MEHLHARFADLALLKNNEIRVLEQTTLSRLMYSCRNPHRRAPYFLRLEHVRRLVRQINAHGAWGIVESSQRTPGKKKGRRDSVSDSDLQKLVSLMELTELLVQQAIPKAAYRLTTELIAREQFVPLATTLVALLARVFVLERPIMLASKGAVAEARLIALPAPRSRNAKAENGTVHAKTLEEDLGEAVTPKKESVKRPVPAVAKKSRKRMRRFFTELTEGTEEESATVQNSVESKNDEAGATEDENGNPEQSEQVKPEVEKEVMSLYDLMAVGDAEVASLAKAQVESSERLTAVVENRQMPKLPRSKKRAILSKKATDDLDAIFAGLSD